MCAPLLTNVTINHFPLNMKKPIKSDHIWYLLATGNPCKPHRIAVKLIKIPNTIPGIPVETTLKHYLQCVI